MRYVYMLIVALILSNTSNAQVQVNINLDNQPMWGPTGYDYVDYYYLPDVDAYYYVPQKRFYYYNNGKWIYRSSLPAHLSHYDFYNSYKVVINEREPWRNHKKHSQKYSSFKGRHDQKPIRDSKESKYFQNKNHPEHNNWLKHQNYDKPKDKSNQKNKKQDKHNSSKDKR